MAGSRSLQPAPALTLSDLPVEILQHIFAFLGREPAESIGRTIAHLMRPLKDEALENRRTLRSLCLVSKKIARSAIKILYSEVSPGHTNVDLNDWWYNRLHFVIHTNPSRLAETRSFFAMSPHREYRMDYALTSFRNLQAIHIECFGINGDPLRKYVCQAIASFEQLRHVSIACRNTSNSSFVTMLLEHLAASHVYDRIRLQCKSFDFDAPTSLLKVKAFHLEGFASTDRDDHFHLFLALDRDILEDLTLQLRRVLHEDYIEHLFGIRWGGLRKLAFIDAHDFDGFTGYGKPENRPLLRTLELDGSSLTERFPIPAEAGEPPTAHCLLLSSLPPTVETLIFDDFDVVDALGILVLHRLLRDPNGPLRNIRFVRLPSLDVTLYDGEQYIVDYLKAARPHAEAVEKLAVERGIRFESSRIVQGIREHLRICREYREMYRGEQRPDIV